MAEEGHVAPWNWNSEDQTQRTCLARRSSMVRAASPSWILRLFRREIRIYRRSTGLRLRPPAARRVRRRVFLSRLSKARDVAQEQRCVLARQDRRQHGTGSTADTVASKPRLACCPNLGTCADSEERSQDTCASAAGPGKGKAQLSVPSRVAKVAETLHQGEAHSLP